jgi:hypothetical protein
VGSFGLENCDSLRPAATAPLAAGGPTDAELPSVVATGIAIPSSLSATAEY